MVSLPIFLHQLGPEKVGLIGFYSLIFSWLSLFDFGFGPTVLREVSIAKARELTSLLPIKILNTFESIFLLIGLIIFSLLYFSSSKIADVWIQEQNLHGSSITICIKIIAILVPLRLFCGLYRAGLNGGDYLIWQNVNSAIINFVRFAGCLILIVYISKKIEVYFIFQLITYIFESWFLRRKAITSFGPCCTTKRVYLNKEELKKILPFSASIFYLTILSTFSFHFDKLILSHILPLTEFGYFSIMSAIVGGISLISLPVSQAVLPKMTKLIASGYLEKFKDLYIFSSKICAVVALSTGLVISWYGKEIVFAWTGDKKAAEWIGSVIVWFALASSITSVGMFQYFLQNAFGKLNLHIVGATIFSILQTPFIYFLATKHGAIGAGIAIFISNSIMFLVWTSIVHKVYLPKFHNKWLFQIILPNFFIVLILFLFLSSILKINGSNSRIGQGVFILSIYFLTLIFALLLSMKLNKIKTFFLKT